MKENIFHKRLDLLNKSANSCRIHKGRRVGIEKESLRVDHNGRLSHKIHPASLGSALTHPYITTDYSEALLELVVPPCLDIDSAMQFLQDIHIEVFKHLSQNEMLWPASMPCIVRNESDIPLAYYGTSNMGQMKSIYRRGLGYRYGRAMQTIAGVHFNYSFGDELWRLLYSVDAQDQESLSDFRSRRYMDLLRNFLRNAWLVSYLFGVSPAVCRNFIESTSNNLEVFDEFTLYGQYATSLRMGDIGYQNNQEAKIGIKASYNNLRDYIESLKDAITKEHTAYRDIGVNVAGEYRQLNACILQIENEYYSSARPKPSAYATEMPLLSLAKHGVEYIEIRSLDVSVFEPLGINRQQLYWMEALLWFCLLDDSPAIVADDWQGIDHNEIETAHRGRQPGLQLLRAGKPYRLQRWGLEVCDRMRAVCELLDATTSSDVYCRALDEQVQKLEDSQHCPSAQLLEEMKASDASFIAFSQCQARRYKEYFKGKDLSSEKSALYADTARKSLREQEDLESSDKVSLEEYIDQYFSQINQI